MRPEVDEVLWKQFQTRVLSEDTCAVPVPTNTALLIVNSCCALLLSLVMHNGVWRQLRLRISAHVDDAKFHLLASRQEMVYEITFVFQALEKHMAHF